MSINSSDSGISSKPKKRTQGTLRLVIVFLALIAQVLMLVFIVGLLRHYALYLYFVLEIVGAIAMTIIVTKNRNPAYAVFWLIIMMVLPVFGYLLYLFWGTTGLSLRKSKKIQESVVYSQQYVNQDPDVLADFLNRHPQRQRIGSYLKNEGFPIYKHTRCTYYPLGELQFAQMIEDLENAQKFIFLGYFIIAEGQLWDQIHEILRRKADQGVDVRIMLDDFGSIVKISDTFARELKRENIKLVRFNPVHLNIFRLGINYRDHQKITVIDGNIGYTGGTNIGDEYANISHRLGHWRDTAVRLEGEAVWGLTVTFLQLWDAYSDVRSDYADFKPSTQVDGPGFYQPFADGPVNNPDNPAEDMYSQIISSAHHYVYITTPYLVIDNAMTDTLCMAAKGGIDVRIVTPKIWDHSYVHKVTQSNYEVLLAAGVKIYEYSPGFIHSKIVLSDDDIGIIGSINMDYRSFFLHFENAVWICGSPVLQDIKADLLSVFAMSEEIGLEEWKRRPWHKKFVQNIFRVLAPLF